MWVDSRAAPVRRNPGVAGVVRQQDPQDSPDGHDFSNEIGKLSCPLLVLFLRFDIISLISYSNMGVKNIDY